MVDRAAVAPAGSPAAPASSPPAALGPALAWARRWGSFLLLLVVLAAALVVGSGVVRGGPASPAQRAAALEAQLKCPSCEDVSVADSSAPTAVAVRRQVAAMIAAGRTNQEIETSLVARYGETILLAPPASGLAALVWIVPGVVGAGAVGTLGVFFWRRSKSFGRLRAAAREGT